MSLEVESELGGGRITRIDGIRAVAVLLVFAFHTGFIAYGWMGVHLFFVLSGFLITGILRRARDEPHFWGPFYIKRAARILPPLVIIFVAAAIFYHMYPWRPVVALDMFFLSNIGQVLYPSSDANLGLLWSLAVEEHFYLLWPIAIRFLDRRIIVRILAAVLVLSPILRALATPYTHDHGPIFYLTPFQLDGLAAGSLLALLVENPANLGPLRRFSGWSALLSFASLNVLYLRLASFNRETNSVLFNSLGYTLIVFFGFTFLAFVLTRPQALVVRALNLRWVVFLGTISYGIYLFNPLPLSFITGLGRAHGIHHDKLTAPIALILTVLVAWVSFRFYETPIIKFGRSRARRLEHGNHPVPPSPITTEA